MSVSVCLRTIDHVRSAITPRTRGKWVHSRAPIRADLLSVHLLEEGEQPIDVRLVALDGDLVRVAEEDLERSTQNKGKCQLCTSNVPGTPRQNTHLDARGLLELLDLLVVLEERMEPLVEVDNLAALVLLRDRVQTNTVH